MTGNDTARAVIWAVACFVAACQPSTSRADGLPAARTQDAFAGKTCEEVGQRAGAIMVGRVSGLTRSDAYLHLQKSPLDLTLINAAYDTPRPASRVEDWQLVGDFEQAWKVRCSETRGDTSE